ncbi:spondin-1-like isoform X1 [Haliotis rufescens]|uniref:spondin-1-like isoform X1 n=2 Tax=Haliotis rufescens TaxID=6454 RepID=UPI001EAFE21A|nr:spondin-1-like isoform X1 [Haliotis rufescens]
MMSRVKGLPCVCTCVLVLVALARVSQSYDYAKRICARLPIHTTEQRSPGNNGFKIIVESDTESDITKYRPGEKYTVILEGSEDQTLLGYMLVAVPQGAEEENATVGHFDIKAYPGYVKDLMEDDTCDHHVMSHHYLMKKKSVRVQWVAPTESAGCVEFRTTVIESSRVWYKDNGTLTKLVCEEMTQQDSVANVPENAPSPLQQKEECCACGHAKYVITFKGLWSRHTHPKNFPTGDSSFLLHWSNIVGASHSNDYRIWDYGGMASEAVREVCEYGSSRSLTEDMKRNSKKIRTVVKTDSLWGPDRILDSVDAVFTVNSKKHLLSLLTMIGPSPDWCLGISALDMCQKNCTWADTQEIDLYPWDAGTDSGVSYESPNENTYPRESIHAITNSIIRNRASPFFGSQPIKPMGRLILKKTYEACSSDHGEANSAEKSPSTDELVSEMKKKMMMQKKQQMEKCATSQWNEWGDCSNPCGNGMRQRRRMFKNPGITQSMCNVEMMEKETCVGNSGCNAKRRKMQSFKFRHAKEVDPSDMCAVTPWSDWSPCSRTCGLGMKERWRMFLRKSQKTDDCGVHLQEKDLCRGIIPDCDMAAKMKNYTVICNEDADTGPCRGMFIRWFYNASMQKCQAFTYGGCRGNENKFDTQEECVELCAEHMMEVNRKQMMIEKQMLMKKQMMQKQLMQKQEMQKKQAMMKKQQMEANADREGQSLTFSHMDLKTLMMKKKMMQQSANLKMERALSDEIKRRRKERRMMKQKKKMERRKRRHRKEHTGSGVNCMVTPWSDWSECSVTCGKGMMTKTRMVKVQPQNGGRKCPRKLMKKKKCKVDRCPIDCELSQWADWQECSATCGKKSVQVRRRKVLQKAKHGGIPCAARREKRFCSLPMCPNEDLEKDMRRFMLYHRRY